MRLPLFTFSLLFIAFLAGCANPWVHDDLSGVQAENQFKRDSLACEVRSGEKFPLDKHAQLADYQLCMSERGWRERRAGDGVPLRRK